MDGVRALSAYGEYVYVSSLQRVMSNSVVVVIVRYSSNDVCLVAHL